MQDIKNFTKIELKDFLIKSGFPGFCGAQVFGWVYKHRLDDFDKMGNISKKTKDFLKHNFHFSKIKILDKQISSDFTQKILFQLNDGFSIESVLIPEADRLTLCLSTQVGCKFKCSFCLSGQAGFKRNLTAGEIVSQYLVLDKPNEKITNLVFMGIGEPLDNYDNLLKAIDIFTDDEGLCLSKHRICVSSAGIPQKIKELAARRLGIKLSISLHCADSRKRSEIMPINKIYPLDQVMEAVKKFCTEKNHPITFEYTLIKGFNTSKEDIDKLIRLLKSTHAKLNLIACNPAAAGENAPSQEEINFFKDTLKKKRIFFTLRKSRGQDIDAACGQLRAKFEHSR